MRVALSASRGAFYAMGSLTPARAKGKRVYVEWATKAGGKRKGYKWATISPKGSHSSYKVRIVIPKRGTWFVRAVAPDDGRHALTSTAPIRVRLR